MFVLLRVSMVVISYRCVTQTAVAYFAVCASVLCNSRRFIFVRAREAGLCRVNPVRW